MSRAARVGWCPSIATPMAAADGLLVRIKPTASTISAAALRAIADAAAAYGNGLVDLTSRSNLQVRGLKPDTVADFAEIAVAHGLAAADPAIEEVRNVAADPLGPDDPEAAFDSRAIARDLEAMLAAEPRLTALPPKFGFLVDCGRLMPMPDARADIMVRADGERLVLTLDGGASSIPCALAEAPAIARRLALAFLDLAGPPDAPPYRMRELVAMVGEDKVLAATGLEPSAAISTADATQAPPLTPSIVVPAGAHQRAEPGPGSHGAPRGAASAPHSASCPDLFRASTGDLSANKDVDGRDGPGHDGGVGSDHATAPDAGPEARHPAPSVVIPAAGAEPGPGSHCPPRAPAMYAPAPPGSPVGFLPFPGNDAGAFVVGVPRGRTDAATLIALAGHAARFADATIRLTPWRAFAFVPVATADAPTLAATLDSLGLVTHPADPRRLMPGHPFEPLDRSFFARTGATAE